MLFSKLFFQVENSPTRPTYKPLNIAKILLIVACGSFGVSGCSGDRTESSVGVSANATAVGVSPTSVTSETSVASESNVSALDLENVVLTEQDLVTKHAQLRSQHLGSDNIVFPADAGVINLKEAPYGAVGDGTHDDTAAIQAALTANPNGRAILYLPNGTYLISKTLRFPDGPYVYGLVNLQGQSTTGTVLKLKDNTVVDATAPKAVINCGSHGSADYFSNSVRNLTINTGVGNPGAIGLQFFSNNMGSVRNVNIVSGDGQGVTGLDLGYNDQNGPLLVKELKVDGFQYGVKTGNIVNSQTFEYLNLSNQSVTGFYNGGQVVSIRGLLSRNTVPAVFNAGVMTLIDSVFIGSNKGEAAIKSSAVLFARNLFAIGYSSAIVNTGGEKNGASGPYVGEFVSQAGFSQFASGVRSLNLVVKDTPEVVWDPLSEWANVVSFGADPTGNADSTAAIQAAIDSGKRTVYLPRGGYKISSTIFIRNKVRRIIGTQSYVDVPATVNPGFKLVDGPLLPPVVVFERIDSGYATTPTLENASKRTLVIKDGTNISGNMTGPGDVFIENVTSNPFSSWTFGKQRVWARQINPENDGTKITNNGGSLWILGLKTERGGTLIDTRLGGETELLGGMSYTTTSPNGRPMLIINESSVSATLTEVSFAGTPFTNLVQETRGAVSKTLVAGSPVPNWVGGGSVLPLYTGYLCPRSRWGGTSEQDRKACR